MWAPVVIEADQITRMFENRKAGMLAGLTILVGIPAFALFVAPFLTMLGYAERGADVYGQAAFGVLVAFGWVLLARGAIRRVRRAMALHRLHIAIGGGAVTLRLPQREVTVMLHDIARVAMRSERVRGLFGARTVYKSAIGLTDGKWIVLGALTHHTVGKLIYYATQMIAHARGVAVEDLGAAGWTPAIVTPGAAARA